MALNVVITKQNRALSKPFGGVRTLQNVSTIHGRSGDAVHTRHNLPRARCRYINWLWRLVLRAMSATLFRQYYEEE